jgi:biopolymer transport protein ExbD
MKRFDDINVVPLIDVMLVLLAVVLITASFIVHDSMDLQLPDTESTTEYVPTKDETKNFAIDAEGTLYIDDKKTSYDEFKQQAHLIPAKTGLIIKVDENAKFGDFVKLVDIFKQHQLHNLTFLTDKAEKK